MTREHSSEDDEICLSRAFETRARTENVNLLLKLLENSRLLLATAHNPSIICNFSVVVALALVRSQEWDRDMDSIGKKANDYYLLK